MTFNNVTTPTAGVVTYTWNLGDGATSDAVSPTHTYTVPGSYGIVLTATQPDGLDLYSQLIQMNYPRGLPRGIKTLRKS